MQVRTTGELVERDGKGRARERTASSRVALDQTFVSAERCRVNRMQRRAPVEGGIYTQVPCNLTIFARRSVSADLGRFILYSASAAPGMSCPVGSDRKCDMSLTSCFDLNCCSWSRKLWRGVGVRVYANE